jgi:hypothetical protein
MKLLIHADPGARGGFVAAWLQNKLTATAFDAGFVNSPKFYKIHHLSDALEIKNFTGCKIRIRPTFEKLDLHVMLFLRKNVQIQQPDFIKDEYDLKTFAKLWNFSKEIFQWDSELDYGLYDYVLNFESTFDNDYMISLYEQVNQSMPSINQIEILKANNRLNNIAIDQNHCASLIKVIFLKEKALNLKEENRFWSIVDVFNTVPVSKRWETIHSLIMHENYGTFLKEEDGIF